MKFSIIIPTHRRGEELIRTVNSVLHQTYQDWEAIVINDSPNDPSYQKFASSINDPRIHYHVNEENYGVNYSRNRALENVSGESNWIIFLDDDDYFAPDTLETFRDLILSNQNKKWFVTNRAHIDGSPITKFPNNDSSYSYAWSYLILKYCKGDATHCIETKLVNKLRFSNKIKQGEEWFFFYQVGLKSKMYYHNHNSTISHGYDGQTGLNFRKRGFLQQIKSLYKIFIEGSNVGLTLHPTFLIYMLMRIIRAVVK